MQIELLKSKINRAHVTQAELHYVGSITIDEDLMDAAGIIEYEKVDVVDIDNGSRLTTYAICGDRGSGVICLNGAAARLVSVGDKVIIMSYCRVCPEEAKQLKPKVVLVGDDNLSYRVMHEEKHGPMPRIDQ